MVAPSARLTSSKTGRNRSTPRTLAIRVGLQEVTGASPIDTTMTLEPGEELAAQAEREETVAAGSPPNQTR